MSLTRLEKILLVLVLVLVVIIVYQNFYPYLTSRHGAKETPVHAPERGKEREQAYTIMTYWEGEMFQLLNQSAQEYAKSNGIKVKVVLVPYDEFFSKLYSSYNIGAAPDLFIAPHYYVRELVENGVADAIDPLPEEIAESFRKAGTLGGKTYCIPVTVDSPILLVRRDLEDSLPKSIEEIVKVNNTSNDRLILAFDVTNSYLVSGWFNALGASFLDTDCKKTYVGGGTYVFEILQKFSENMPRSGDYIQMVEKGDAIATIITTSRLRSIQDMVKFDILEIPVIKGQKVTPYSTLECIFLSTTAKDGSQELAKYVAERVAEKLVNIGVIVAWSNAYTNKDEAYYKAYLVALNSEPLPPCKESVKVLIEMSECLRNMKEQGWSAEPAVVECEKHIKDLLKG